MMDVLLICQVTNFHGISTGNLDHCQSSVTVLVSTQTKDPTRPLGPVPLGSLLSGMATAVPHHPRNGFANCTSRKERCAGLGAHGVEVGCKAEQKENSAAGRHASAPPTALSPAHCPQPRPPIG